MALAIAVYDTSTTVNIRGQSYRLHEKRHSGVLLDLPGSSAQKAS